MSNFDVLNDRVLDAHETGDTKTLVDIYLSLGMNDLRENAIDAGCFLLTQAYVYALESGDPRSTEIHKTLMIYGREE